MTEWITVKNAKENNLKGVSLQIPKGKITVFTGVSGSGKSSIVFDTIAQEAGRQLNETYNSFTRLFLPRYARPDVEEINHLSVCVVIDQKRLGGNARSTVGTATDINSLFRLLFSRFGKPRAGKGFANSYSFNDPEGMCDVCQGIGKTITLNLDTVLDPEKALSEGAILLPGYGVGTFYWKEFAHVGLFDIDKKIKDYSEEEMHLLLHESGRPLTVTYKSSTFETRFEGLVPRFMRTLQRDQDVSEAKSKKLEKFTIMDSCPTCHGKRYRKEVLDSKINGYSIYDLTELELDQLQDVLDTLHVPEGQIIIDGIKSRVQSLVDIGLGYMNLNRESETLSGGESQRIKMVKYLSSSLNQMIYIFDEPSTGLHPRDVYRLNDLLRKIRDKGNTVIVVEHDPDVIAIADYVIDVGPKAGSHGGEITFAGTYQELLRTDTLTGRYLRERCLPAHEPRAYTTLISSKQSTLHNLKNVALRIPEGVLTVVTGVAGSGKSTLTKVFLKEHPHAVYIDQSGVHTNSRSNPATFIGIMDLIRSTYAKVHGQPAGLFSYNSIGKCETCGGSGKIELNLSYMDKSEVECSDCQGNRYKPAVLEYLYKEKNIVDVMNMTMEDAYAFFDDPKIKKQLEQLITVGLSYLTLGQPLDTLSGGEAQRLKLAKELKTNGKLYILDEPTSGLHLSDVEHILRILDELVEQGITVIVIEHHLDVIRHADWIVDLGPDGGNAGGEILFEGRVADLKQCSRSITGRYL